MGYCPRSPDFPGVAALDPTNRSVPERFHDRFEKRTVANLATTHPDGVPPVTPVWIGDDPDPDHLLVTTASGRRTVRNGRRAPR